MRSDHGLTGATHISGWQLVKKDIEGIYMLWTIVAVLLILWLLGFSLHLAGGLVHILLVVAVVVVLFNLLSGRRALG